MSLAGFLVLSSLVSGQVPAQEKEGETFLRDATPPTWIVRHDVDLKGEAPENSNHGDVYFLLADRQINAAEEERFYHYAYRFLSENGVQDRSQLSWDFDPAYEKFTLHELRVHRNGTVIDKLKEQEIKLLQREEGHERQLYDGGLSAVAVVEDLRVGDVLEYSYSLKGENPVFLGKFSHTESIRWGSPVHQSRFRFLCEKDRPMRTKSVKSPVELLWKPAENRKEIAITEDHLKAILGDGDVPSWYDERPWVEFSEYDSWEEVADWAAVLYDLDQEIPETLRTEIDRISKLESDEERILEALRWCQDEVRYLGMFEGMHSHKPYPLKTIVRRRFGDCKDKSMLLTTMLRELGFNARLALVATGGRHMIKEWLPSPDSFNHVVVQLRFQDRDFWLDPTRSFQRGKLSELYFPAYGYALPVSEETGDLTPVTPSGHDRARLEITETFDLKDYSGEAELTIVSKHTGREANRMRSSFASNSLESTEKSYLNHYSKEYPDIESAKPLRFEDNEADNTFTTWETYRIRNIWLPREGEGEESMQIEFYARVIGGELDLPDTRIRTAPFAMSHPRQVTQRIVLNLPTPLTLEDGFTEIKNSAFEMSLKEIGEPQRFEGIYRYRSLSRQVPAEETAQYIKDIEAGHDLLSYQIWVPKSYAGKSVEAILAENEASGEIWDFQPNWTLIAVLLMACFIASGIGILLFFWNPKPMAPPDVLDPNLKGIGGWLVLVCIGLLVRPFHSLHYLGLTVSDWTPSTWLSVGDPSSEVYDALWQPLVMLEMITMCGFLAWEILLLVLFFSKRTSFPRLIATYFVAQSGFVLLFSYLWSLIEGFDEAVLREYQSEIPRILVVCAIWTPYHLVSRRVRLTFVNRRRKNPTPPPLPVPGPGQPENESRSDQV